MISKIKQLRAVLWFLLFIFDFGLNQPLMAESEAEIRANARILQEHIDAQNAQIEKEADRIYNKIKSESLRNYIASQPPATFGDYLIGLTCIGSFCLFILFLIAPDFVINIFTSISDLFSSKPEDSKVTFRYNVSDGVSSSKSDHEKYLDELRKPLNLINEKFVEAHLTGFISKIKNQAVNLIGSSLFPVGRGGLTGGG